MVACQERRPGGKNARASARQFGLRARKKPVRKFPRLATFSRGHRLISLNQESNLGGVGTKTNLVKHFSINFVFTTGGLEKTHKRGNILLPQKNSIPEHP